MVFQEKHQVEELAEAPEIWVMAAGISLRAPLKPVKTSKPTANGLDNGVEEEEEEKSPVARRTMAAERSVCPPAPKKPKPSFLCRLGGVEFFRAPEDLRAVFVVREERSK